MEHCVPTTHFESWFVKYSEFKWHYLLVTPAIVRCLHSLHYEYDALMGVGQAGGRNGLQTR